ncbi:uncharacterized protein [Nicotiana tomentosiformis]|uniref:uncharacterized protein n=1 Tax=Nicotiana tomentosiformis TaxID=4098 RepID=UPI00388C5496
MPSLVSAVFDGKGYRGWRRAVVIALSAKNTLGFIDGNLRVPQAESGLQKSWTHCNDMVLSWLLNSLSKEIAESVLYSQSTKDFWSDREDRFGQTNGAKLFQLQKELSSVVQKNSSVSTFFTKMKSLWDELDALNTFSAYVCECEFGAKAKSVKAHQNKRLLQFLMDPNDIFIGVRNNILMSFPLPSIGQDIGGFDAKKSSGICKYYKKSGHSIEKCYRLHDFSTDFMFTKQKRFQVKVQANNAFNTNEEREEGANSNVKEKLWHYKLGHMSLSNMKKISSVLSCF